MIQAANRLWSSAWTLLVLVNLFWAGNIVVGRAVAGQVPPVALAYWRWTGAFLLALGLAWPHLKRDWPVLLKHWRMMLLLAMTGFASLGAGAGCTGWGAIWGAGCGGVSATVTGAGASDACGTGIGDGVTAVTVSVAEVIPGSGISASGRSSDEVD